MKTENVLEILNRINSNVTYIKVKHNYYRLTKKTYLFL